MNASAEVLVGDEHPCMPRVTGLKLRLLPISGGIFSGPFRSEQPPEVPIVRNLI